MTRRQLLALLTAAPAFSAGKDFLQGFQSYRFTAAGRTKTVYRIDGGPPVLFLHETPGLMPEAFEFARRLNDGGKGFTVYVPLLFGSPGQSSDVRVIFQTPCWTSEFDCQARHSLGTIVDWIERLARTVSRDRGNQGLGVIGNCLTGSMPLALMARPESKRVMRCAVLSQPAVPLSAFGRPRNIDTQRSVGLTDPEMERAVNSRVPVLALKFDDAPYVPEARMEFLKQEFRNRPFEYYPVPHDDHCHTRGAHPPRHHHAVLTLGYCGDPQSGGLKAYQKVETFLKQHLGGAQS